MDYPQLIVGIGASAGGLKPIEEFFDHMPPDSGMSFVIIQHLSPDFKSLMDELLSRHTSMEIHKVNDGVHIEPNSIYLIPPEKNMAMSDGRLLLTDKPMGGGLSLPIDIFFRSLATDAGRKAVAIVLSGTGSDGSRGITDVHEAGGVVFAQSAESSGFDGMPLSAMATGTVDFVGAPKELAQRLLQFCQSNDRAIFQKQDPDAEDTFEQQGLFGIFRLFRERYGIDFSLYKPATIMRRLERRMKLSGMTSIDVYIDRIQEDNDESEALFRDLLVEVTQFFRDPEAFQRLREFIVPDLLQRTDPMQEVRVWVCGCATGEEAFSIAMVLHEAIEKIGRKQNYKVFATDVHRKSLETASHAFYPVASLEHVPADFKEKYFVRNNGVCNVTREIRQNVIFASNDLTRDPPFTRLDLISCRNVLIYLEPKVQKRILAMFHFGLRTKGVLFLGPSETVGELDSEFEQLDRHWRIYSKQRDVRLPEATRMPLTPVLTSVVHEQTTPFVGEVQQFSSPVWLTTAYEDLLAKHVPPSLLINEYNELMHCFGEARKLLSPPEGKPSSDILKMLDKDLSVAVSAAIHRAKQEDKLVTYKGIRVRVDEQDERLYQVTVEPYKKARQSLFLVALEEMEKVEPIEKIVEQFQVGDSSAERIAQLERELNYSRETLQATVEELESSNEELQATNEELIASNEELQSTNEELHSVNEELYTVNTEHKQKIEELTELTSDMDNLLRSTEIGTIFLDRNFNIRMFTPSITSAFNVLEQDIGRPIDHIAYKFDNPNLLSDAAEVLKGSLSKESQVKSKDGNTYLQRIQPYRVEGKIDGVVLTLTDVTAIKEAELARMTVLSLAEVSQELPDFAYAVSHDLQAPLRHISQYSEILESAIDQKNDADVLKASQVIKSSAGSLREMLDGLLGYSRINTTGQPLEQIDLQKALNGAILDLKTALEINEAKINVARDLPKVLGDKNQMQLLFYHLIDNGIKYRGVEPPQIDISFEPLEDQIQITVSDNGIGVESRNAEDIFTIFKRLGVKENVPGGGVGLAICRRIVLRHHGRIWLEPSPGAGASFCFTLREVAISPEANLIRRPRFAEAVKKNTGQIA